MSLQLLHTSLKQFLLLSVKVILSLVNGIVATLHILHLDHESNYYEHFKSYHIATGTYTVHKYTCTLTTSKSNYV